MFVDLITKMPVENIIELDDEIYPIIKVLWDKGYKTKYCCAGHNEVCYIEYYGEEPKKIHDLYKNYQKIQIYICFDGTYEFADKPEGFDIYDAELFQNLNTKTKSTGDVMVECIINIFDKNNVMKSSKEIDYQLHYYQNELLKWANNLPNINESIYKKERKNKI